MIYRVRTISLAPDTTEEAQALASKAAAYATEHFPDVAVEILTNVAGPQHQIHMVTRCKSLGALEEYEESRKTDAGWLALVEEWRTHKLGAESVDRLYRSVS